METFEIEFVHEMAAVLSLIDNHTRMNFWVLMQLTFFHLLISIWYNYSSLFDIIGYRLTFIFSGNQERGNNRSSMTTNPSDRAVFIQYRTGFF